MRKSYPMALPHMFINGRLRLLSYFVRCASHIPYTFLCTSREKTNRRREGWEYKLITWQRALASGQLHPTEIGLQLPHIRSRRTRTRLNHIVKYCSTTLEGLVLTGASA